LTEIFWPISVVGRRPQPRIAVKILSLVEEISRDPFRSPEEIEQEETKDFCVFESGVGEASRFAPLKPSKAGRFGYSPT
jgi:hypothetical protein